MLTWVKQTVLLISDHLCNLRLRWGGWGTACGTCPPKVRTEEPHNHFRSRRRSETRSLPRCPQRRHTDSHSRHQTLRPGRAKVWTAALITHQNVADT